MLSDLPRPAVFAHRGARTQAPENTLAAFELALAQGADAIELDTRLTADGQVVVFHDATLERTTNGNGLVAQSTLTELQALDAGAFFSEQFRGEKIPRLEDALEALAKKTFINVEIKDHGRQGESVVQRVCELIAERGLEERVLLSSFFVRNLKKAAILLPCVPRGLLAAKSVAGAWARSFGFAFGDYAALHPSVGDIDARTVQRVHRLKRRIHVWTVDVPAQIEQLKSWGADGIITDDPALALRALGRST